MPQLVVGELLPGRGSERALGRTARKATAAKVLRKIFHLTVNQQPWHNQGHEANLIVTMCVRREESNAVKKKMDELTLPKEQELIAKRV